MDTILLKFMAEYDSPDYDIRGYYNNISFDVAYNYKGTWSGYIQNKRIFEGEPTRKKAYDKLMHYIVFELEKNILTFLKK